MWDAELDEVVPALEQDVPEFEMHKDIGWITRTSQPLQNPDLRQALETYLGASGPKVAEYRPLKILSIKKLNYSTFEKHRGNSNVMISSPCPVPARIFHIFQVQDSRKVIHTLLAVRRYMEFGSQDPFQKYPALQMKLWLAGSMEQLEVVHPNSVLHHFASLQMTINFTKVVATISLSRT